MVAKEIKSMYRGAGLEPPKGKGLHTDRAHEAVVRYMRQGMPKDEAWKRVMGGMGAKNAVKKPHQRRKENPRAYDLSPQA